MLSRNLKKLSNLTTNGPLRRCGLATSQTQSKSQPLGQVEVSTLPSGIVLASVGSESPFARIAVVVRAGARYESPSKLGASHLIRSATGLASEKYSSFSITRNIEYFGGQLTVAGNRDTIAYLFECRNDDDLLQPQLSMLVDTITKPVFKHWELADNQERIKADLSVLDDNPLIQLSEILHKVAFKGGLRNSLYIPKFNLGKITSEDLKKYHKETFVGQNTVVVGVGVPHQTIMNYIGKTLILPATTGKAEKSKFIGGEFHGESNSPLTYVAIACEGVSLKKTSDVVAASLLQKILGHGSQIRISNELSQVQRLGRAVRASIRGQPSSDIWLSTFNLNYEDTGLFGINLIAPKTSDLTGLVKTLVKEFRATCNSVSDAELNDAKKNLKTSILIAMDDETSLANEIGQQLLLTQQALTIEQLNQAIDKITVNDLKSLGSRFLKSKVALATIGQNAPYLEDVIE